MKIRSIDKPKDFIPTFKKNRELPTDEQIHVKISRFPSIGEIKTYKNTKFTFEGSYMTVYKDFEILTNHVDSITNLDLGSEKVTDGKTLYNSTNTLLSDLLTEVRQYLLESAEELEKGES
jgi:hypothetical protein